MSVYIIMNAQRVASLSVLCTTYPHAEQTNLIWNSISHTISRWLVMPGTVQCFGRCILPTAPPEQQKHQFRITTCILVIIYTDTFTAALHTSRPVHIAAAIRTRYLSHLVAFVY